MLTCSWRSSPRTLTMFGGDAVLPGAGDRDWVVPARARFDEGRLGMTEDRAAALILLGAGRELIGELDALVVRHPVEERPRTPRWASSSTPSGVGS
jgi:DNA-binding SARP family transcriptional activator